MGLALPACGDNVAGYSALYWGARDSYGQVQETPPSEQGRHQTDLPLPPLGNAHLLACLAEQGGRVSRLKCDGYVEVMQEPCWRMMLLKDGRVWATREISTWPWAHVQDTAPHSLPGSSQMGF